MRIRGGGPLRVWGRWLSRAALIVVLPLIAYAVAALAGAVIPGRVAETSWVSAGGPPVTIGLVSGPIHVDFVLPATSETRAAFFPALAAGVPIFAPDARVFVVGWGARDFYTTAGTFRDIEAGAVLRAVTGDASVLRVDAWGGLPEGFPMTEITLSGAQYFALVQAIAGSISGGAIEGAGFTTTDGFLEAEGRFHIFSTCNTWVGRMLREAGQPFGAWTPTPYAVRLSARWFAGAE